MKTLATLLMLIISSFLVSAQPNPKNIDPQQMQQELKLLQQALTSLHPGIYRYETPAQIQAVFRATQQKVQQPIPASHYFILIAQMLTHIHCGHTCTNYWNQPAQVTAALYCRSYLPILYRIINGQIIVTHNLSASDEIKAGDEIVAINHIPVKQIIDSLLTVSPSDGLHGQPRKLDNMSVLPLDADTSHYNLADVFMPLFFPVNFNTERYAITLRHYNQTKPADITVASLSKKERLAVYNSRFGILPVHEKNWSLKMMDKQTACFTIGDFETWEWKASYKTYLDSVFTLLRQQHVANLIVDIRGNSGGDDNARDEVFSYLTSRPFGCTDPMHRKFRFLSVPDTLLPFLQTWDKTFKQPKNALDYQQGQDGLYEKKADMNTPCELTPSKPNHFAGREFLVTDCRNASTTFTLAKLFKTERTGTIVGETTSGNQQGINGGQFFFLNLPFSKIEIDVPLVWGAYTGIRPDTGTAPDRPVNTTRRSIALHQDAQMEAVLAVIAGN